MKKKLIIITFLLGIILLTATVCKNFSQSAKNENTWAKISQKKQVVIGLDDSFVPMGFTQKNGQLAGYDIDLARELFKLYGIQVDFQTIDWSMNATELRNGTIDLIWNGYSITDQRKKKVMFSRPYLKNEQVLVVKKDSRINSFAKMKNKSIGLQTGSTAEQWYESKQKVLRAKEAILYDQIPNAFLDLNSGRIQGIFLDEVYANYYLAHQSNKNEYRVIMNKLVPVDLFAVGMRKGDYRLRAKINQGLKKLQKNGQLERLNEKWFGKKSSYLGR